MSVSVFRAARGDVNSALSPILPGHDRMSADYPGVTSARMKMNATWPIYAMGIFVALLGGLFAALAPPEMSVAVVGVLAASLVAVPVARSALGVAGNIQDRVGVAPMAVLVAPTVLGLTEILPSTYAYPLIALLGVCALPRILKPTVPLAAYAPLVFLYFALVLVAFIRAESLNLVVIWGSFLVFASAVILTANERELPRLRNAIALSPAVFVAANVALLAVGVGAGDSIGDGSAVVLELLGFDANRTLFPMAFGYADFGGAACLGLVGTLMMQRQARGIVQRSVLLVGSLVCVYGLMAVDVRGAFIAVLLSGAVVLLAGPGMRRSLALVALAIPVTAVLATAAVGAVAQTSDALSLNRAGTDPSTLSGRTYIWDVTTDRLGNADFDQIIGDTVGYGAFGPATEGVSQEYAAFLPSNTDAQTGSTHNFAYQTVFDIGYLGLLVVVALFACTISRLANQPRSAGSDALLAMVLAMVGLGVVDISPSYAAPQVFAVWLMILLVAARGKPRPTSGTELLDTAVDLDLVQGADDARAPGSR